MSRDPVAIICPFAGTEQEGVEVASRLSAIARVERDEVVIVDNTRSGALAELDQRGVAVVPATHEQSSYYARNVGVEATQAEWILFLDSDCVPVETILHEYLAEPLPDDCGAVAGAVVGLVSQSSLLARWARARGVLDQRRLAHKERPFGATANLLVRREAWSAVGGFHEGIRSGGDVDFCWRLQDAGWTLQYRDGAAVEHEHRERLAPLMRQYARYGAGRSWLERRYPDEPRSSKHAALLLASPVLILGGLLRSGREGAAFRAFDAAIVVASLLGRMLDNRPPGREAGSVRPARVVVVADEFPTPDVMRAIGRVGDESGPVAVEAATRSSGLPGASTRAYDVCYAEDDGALRRLRDLGWLAARHPVRTLDLLGTRSAALPSRARRVAARSASCVCWVRGNEQSAAAARQLGSVVGIQPEPLDQTP